MKILLTLFVLFFSSQSFSWDNDLVLKGGLTFGVTNSNSLEDIEDSKENENNDDNDQIRNYGFNTHFGYKFNQLELVLSNHIYFGKVTNMSFRANQSEIKGTGKTRFVGITPNIKYTFNRSFGAINDWKVFIAVGPSWSLQTVKLESFTTNGSFGDNNKLTLESFGGTLSIGIEEQTKFKEMHPVFVDISYSYNQSYELSIVDSSDSTQINILSKDERGQNITNHTILFNMGISIF